MAIDHSVLHRSFDERVIQRGAAYVSEHRVIHIGAASIENVITALVQGSGAEPYSVVLRVLDSPPRLDGQCTCPVSYNCKHAAAVALAVIARATYGHQHEPGDGAVDVWITDFGNRTTPANAETPREHVRYALDIEERYGAPCPLLRAFTVGKRKNGEWAKPVPYHVYNLSSSGHKAIVPLDRTIGRLANAAGFGTTGLGLSPKLFAMLLDLLLASERAYWREVTQLPLVRENAAGSSIAWVLDADGRQRLRLRERPAALLFPCDPVWYVEPDRARAGTIDLPVSGDLGALLARAPSLSPAQAQLLHARLHKTFVSAGLPLPHSDVMMNHVNREPVPMLQLRTLAADKVTRIYARPPIAVAELRFTYDDETVAPGDTVREFRKKSENGITIWPRQHEYENLMLSDLQARGFGALPWPYSTSVERAQCVLSPQLRYAATPSQIDDRWLAFMADEAATLRAAGWHIEVDPSFPYRMYEGGEWDARAREASSTQWFDLELRIDVDGERVSLLPLLLNALAREKLSLGSSPAKVAARERPLVAKSSKGKFVLLDQQRVADALAVIGDLFGEHGPVPGQTLRIPRVRAASLSALKNVRVDMGDAPSLRTFIEDLLASQSQAVRLPRAFRGKLRPYQEDGVCWLQALYRHGFGGVLADDMGLGKTVQMLAHVTMQRSKHRDDDPVLVVAPTSVVPNWRSETARFFPDARVLSLTGSDRSRHFRDISSADIVLTTYALLPRDAESLAKQPWSIVVLDEAQAIKNPKAKAAQAASRLNARQRLALTGTPIENHLEELWSLYACTVPGLLGDRTQFGRTFRGPIEKQGDTYRRRALAARIRPFLLRRTKEQVAKELPEKTEIVQRIELSGAQRDLYESVRLAMHERVRKAIERNGLARSHIVLLDALLKLRQICCDPRLLKSTASAKVTESQKLTALLEMLESMIEDGRRILLFSQFTSMLDLIKPELVRRGISFVELRGDTRNRQAPVERFQAGEVPLFLISLKAGGTGLNLTAADTVIHYDPWWNPAVERQATDRAHRIGQTRHVFVYKLIAEGTVEERIIELQARKGALAGGLLDDTESVTLDLDLAEIERLFN